MNAPHFNSDNLSLNLGSVEWMQSIINEENRCCKDIDARLKVVEAEHLALIQQLSDMQKQMEKTIGPIACIRLYFKMKRISSQMKWRRKVIIELLNARITRTYA